MEPVLKWAGGKRQLLPTLLKTITPELLTGHRYYEPFVGGGSVAFALAHPFTTICDYNAELINVYIVIRDNPDGLIKLLKIHKKNHCQQYYYTVRSWDSDSTYDSLSSTEKAARMLYLNRTCFNGLYRVNKKNHFNVPIGQPSSNDIVQEDRIKSLSRYLRGNDIEIFEGDYSSCLNSVKTGDVIYFDPPYDYEEAGFNKYVTDIFGRNELTKLKDLSVKLVEKGCTVILSNNDTSFVRSLFENGVFTITGIEAKRYINCKSDRRSGIKEVIIFGQKQ